MTSVSLCGISHLGTIIIDRIANFCKRKKRKLHAQTSTLWTLCDALNESYPISQRPLGLTSWTFIVNFQDICSAVAQNGMIVFASVSCNGTISEARCTYILTPYRNLANRSAPFGLDLLGFHGKTFLRKTKKMLTF